MQGFTAPGTTSNWRRLRPGTRASSCAAERLALQNISVTAHRAQSPECRGFGVAHKRRGDTLVPTALRGPKHAYGGPEPFGTGAGLLRWQREATALLAEELRAEREKEWKRLRHKLVTMPPGQPLARTQKLGQQQQQPQQQRQQQQQQQQQQRQQQQQQQQQEALGEPGGPGLGGQLDQHPGPTPGHGPTPAPTAAVTLDEETQQRIERSRMKIRFRKFWDLMHERDRPWHYDAVLHLCSRLPPYSCGRYAAVTAGTMQRILARRAKD